jgi:hypothetical protein
MADTEIGKIFMHGRRPRPFYGRAVHAGRTMSAVDAKGRG